MDTDLPVHTMTAYLLASLDPPIPQISAKARGPLEEMTKIEMTNTHTMRLLSPGSMASQLLPEAPNLPLFSNSNPHPPPLITCPNRAVARESGQATRPWEDD